MFPSTSLPHPPLKIENKARMSALTTFIQLCSRWFNPYNKARKENERSMRKEERKWSIFADNMIIYIGNCKESTKQQTNSPRTS